MEIDVYQIVADQRGTFTETFPVYIKKQYLDRSKAEEQVANYKENNVHHSKLGQKRRWFEIPCPWDINKESLLVYNLRIEEKKLKIEFEDAEVEVFECLPKEVPQ